MNPENIFSTEATSIVDVQHQHVITIAQVRHMPFNTLDFLSVHRAYEKNLLKVEEVSEEGNVNQLLLTNLSDGYIFIMDGDILKGAKQNRVANTSILVAAGVKLVIPVSCVEQGRWAYDRDDLMPSEEVAYRKIREQKARDIYWNRAQGSDKHNVDQHQVWGHVNNYLSDLGEHSATASHSDAFESKRMDIGKMIDGFSVREEANGLAYFINGKLCGIEIFNREDVYSDYFGRLLNSIAMDAQIVMRKSNRAETGRLSAEEVNAVINDTVAYYNSNLQAVDVCKGVCAGEEHRLVTDKEVYYDLSCDGETVHQSIMAYEKDDSFDGSRSPYGPVDPDDRYAGSAGEKRRYLERMMDDR